MIVFHFILRLFYEKNPMDIWIEHTFLLNP